MSDDDVWNPGEMGVEVITRETEDGDGREYAILIHYSPNLDDEEAEADLIYLFPGNAEALAAQLLVAAETCKHYAMYGHDEDEEWTGL